ncbi:MAG: hypothetical protein KGJ23_02800 [Euryarchaeota archaeon]|nr:hypothetical protein [Euryarchaeota archaeon]MDE1835527.1 hypothetical protein [Euryarchaeota archaeon]MDE1879618.1 hypothetical protein [Euryarchaeota archaeon]MDE2043851.1 hypothetical protein [Thermoplasmata archaeon]
MEKVPSWLERLLLPQLSEIKGSILVLGTKIDAVGSKLGSRIDSVENKVDSLRNGLKADIGRVEQRVVSLEKTLDVVRELGDLQAQFAEFKASQRRTAGVPG